MILYATYPIEDLYSTYIGAVVSFLAETFFVVWYNGFDGSLARWIKF